MILVYAKTAPEQGARGISAFLVEKDFPGFSVAQKLIKMGCRGSPTGELVFDDCRVPVANRIGAENAGVAILMSGLDLERAVAAAISVGAAERLLELSLAYARERKQFGRPIAEFQMIQAKLADMYVGLESMKGLAYKALAAVNDLEQGAGGRGEVHKLCAAALLHAAEACSKIAARRRPDPRRRRLHVGDGGEPHLPRHQADRDRRGHERGAAHDHRRGAAPRVAQKR